MPYGKVGKGCLIGLFSDEADMIYYETPRPPLSLSEFMNYGLEQSEQYWRRHEPPDIWHHDEARLNDIAVEKYSSGATPTIRAKNANRNWWRLPSNMTSEMRAYFDQEWDRRINGIWILINGEPTYLTGQHYTYIQHWWLQVGMYPIYKDRNRMDFYAFKSVERDIFCLGLVEPKHRRSNHTSIGAFLGWEISSRMQGGHFAIGSIGKTGAKKVFTDKVVPGWNRLVPFFRPLSPTGTNPVTDIVMDVPSKTGRSKGDVKDGEIGHQARIWYGPNGDGVTEPLNGDHINFLLRDEPGSENDLNINDQWGVLKKCLDTPYPMAPGKAYYPSTRESVKEPYTAAWETMCRDSAISTMKNAGASQTKSGMWLLFLPCFEGHTKLQFIGKFGESIVTKPTSEQVEWLLYNRVPDDENARSEWRKQYEIGGAYEYELQQRVNTKNDPAEIRRMPFTLEEVFATVNPACEFDTEMINANKTFLNTHYRGDKSWLDHLTVQVRLEYVGDIEKGDVYAVEDKKGAFLWNRKYLPVERTLVPGATKHKVDLNGDGGELALKLRIFANNVARSGPRQGMREKFGNVKPITDSGRDHESNTHILIGMDPQGLAQIDQRSKTLSKASSHGFYPYREEIDGEWTEEMEKDPKFAEDWVTHAFIFEYLHHPKEPEVHHSDMLKAAIFLNARILIEKQTSPQFIKYMRDRDCEGFLIRDKAWAKDKSKSVPGLASSQYVIKMYVDRLRSWIKRFCYPNKCPFPRTMEQWMQMDPGDMEKFDAGVSSGYALLAAQPGELRIPTKTNNLPQEEPKGQITLASVYNALRRR